MSCVIGHLSVMWTTPQTVLLCRHRRGREQSAQDVAWIVVDSCKQHTHSNWTTGGGWYVPVPWIPDYIRCWVYDGIPYQVKQRAGDRDITAENMKKSQHTDFNEDTTNDSASVAYSNIRLWKLNTQKEWRNASWRLWGEKTEKDSAGFMDSKENKWVGS